MVLPGFGQKIVTDPRHEAIPPALWYKEVITHHYREVRPQA
jgi:hypothetical protein